MFNLKISTGLTFLTTFVLIVLIFTQIVSEVFGQAEQSSNLPELNQGQLVVTELQANQAHSYNISLSAGQYLRLIVKQIGIDVVVSIYDPSGRKLNQRDSPNGKYGLEPLTIISETGGKHRLEISSLDEKASSGRYELVIKEIRNANEQDAKRRLELNKLFADANNFFDQNTPEAIDSAFVKLETAVLLYKSVGEREEELHTLKTMADLCYGKNLNTRLLKYYDLIQPLQKSFGDKRDEAVSLYYIGLANSNLGENQKALKYYLEAVTIFELVSDINNQASIKRDIGAAYFQIGENAKSIESYLQSAALFAKLDKKVSQANVFSKMGDLSADSGEYQVALKYYEKALSLHKEAKSPRGEALDLNGIGLIYYELGQFHKSLEILNQAVTLLTSPEGEWIKAATLGYIGVNYSRLGDYKKALEYSNESLILFKKFEDKDGIAASLNDIGRIYAKLGDQQKAIDFFRQALSIRREIFERRDEAASLHDIGESYAKLGGVSKAFEYFRQALQLRKSLGDRFGEAQTLRELRNLWSAAGNRYLAIFFGKQSINKFQELRQSINSLSIETQQTYVQLIKDNYHKLADILIAEGRFAEAQQILTLLKEEEYYQYVQRDAEEIKKLSARADLRADERETLRKYESLAGDLTKYGTKFIELEKLKNQQGGDFKQHTEYDDLKAKLDAANAAFRIFLEKELAVELGKSSKREIEIDRSLQTKLQQWGKGTVALYTVVGDDRYRVILTTPKTQVDGKTEIKIADLNKKIFDFRAALQNPAVDPRPLGKELYDILIKPIEKDLNAAEAKTLLWSLDGTLRYIPFAALSPDGVHYLVEKYQNVVITSTTRQSLLAETDSNWRPLGAGVTKESKLTEPNGTQELTFSALPEVKNELLKIVRSEDATTKETGLLTGKRLIDEGFDLSSLENGMIQRVGSKPKYNVIHLATHFRLGGDTAKSFLLMGNNQALTIEKVSDSTALNFGDVELVTLSACNTGFGTVIENKAINKEQERKTLEANNGAEVDSLATFIELRGAKAVLASLWSVADESTQMLMSEFYLLRKENPQMTKAEAIQKAQMAMIAGKLKSDETNEKRDVGVLKIGNENGLPKFETDKNAPFAHPYYWSPFVLIGNWR